MDADVFLLQRTCVFGLRGNLCEKLNKVRQVVPEELGADDEIFASVVGVKLRAEELGFSLDAECRALLGGL